MREADLESRESCSLFVFFFERRTMLPILRPCPELAAYVSGLPYLNGQVTESAVASSMVVKAYHKRYYTIVNQTQVACFIEGE